MGHGGGGENSVGGGAPTMERPEKSLMRLCRDLERPCREWWAVLGTVGEALEGFGSSGLVVPSKVDEEGPGIGGAGFLKYEGGKCFALYVSWTLASSYNMSIDGLRSAIFSRTLKAFLYRFTLSPKLP